MFGFLFVGQSAPLEVIPRRSKESFKKVGAALLARASPRPPPEEADLEQRIEGHDTAIRSHSDAVRQLMALPPASPKPEIGFHVKEDPTPYRTKRKASS